MSIFPACARRARRLAPRVRYWWSWRKLEAGAIKDDGVLPNARREMDSTHDVRFRPVSADLLRRLAAAGDRDAGGASVGAGAGASCDRDLIHHAS